MANPTGINQYTRSGGKKTFGVRHPAARLLAASRAGKKIRSVFAVKQSDIGAGGRERNVKYRIMK